MLPIYDLELDAIYRQIAENAPRTVCVTAANAGEGVSTLSLALARRGTASGLKTLLIDASVRRSPKSSLLWPTHSRGAPSQRWVRNVVTRVDETGLDLLPAPAGVGALILRDAQALRRIFDVELVDYDLIVVDTAPLFPADHNAIPAEAVAAVCATTVLVVLAGVTSEHAARDAVERLLVSGANLSGAVFNDRFNPSLAEEIACKFDRFAWLAPGLVAWLQMRVRRNAILNLRM